MPHEPRPSATRRGQRVDNPIISSTSDTGKLRLLIESETADDLHNQAEINAEVHTKLAVHHERWNQFYRTKFAYKSDIRHIWIALSAIGAIGLVCLTLLLDLAFKHRG